MGRESIRGKEETNRECQKGGMELKHVPEEGKKTHISKGKEKREIWAWLKKGLAVLEEGLVTELRREKVNAGDHLTFYPLEKKKKTAGEGHP